MHRVTWDLHWSGLEAEPRSYRIAAVPGDTPAEPRGPWAVPGTYTVRLTAAGTTMTAPLIVRMDPRVQTPARAIEEQIHVVVAARPRGIGDRGSAAARTRRR